MRFELIDHTADIGIAAFGHTLEEAFANLAYGMFSVIVDLDNIREELERDFDIESSDREALVVDWLNELLYTFDVERLVFSRFDILGLTDNRLRARAYGEQVDLSRHNVKTGIKAATYHSLRIEESDGYRIQVILDI